MSSIFSKIIAREIPADIVYEDDLVLAFHDIAPSAPVHILIIPKREIATANDVEPDDEAALGRMISVGAQIAAEQGIAADGYRLIINCNEHGGQEVFHLHMHLVGGRSLGPMLTRPKKRRST
ncbi:MAG: HIT domain-containing protein [Chloroflexi bacterium]|nr:HIT domain-containing protein [Chloroflexota bacterium]MCY3582014.1 HIT domain-containing protein [Chloroflexota bacterium]MCY3716527.1 HIT domain-containing protein [Chloroflexota bacterium]MDE2651636.1 HIT domain-containing protein [Chloroflexota bacterium]MXV92704.1 HIT domain-containing protein [Chloroflexota bacterium]